MDADMSSADEALPIDEAAPLRAGAGHTAPLPLVSCTLLTYNRYPDYRHLVEEAVESFLRQTYPNKELVVLNDCPGQELICDAPGVRVINVPERFPTLGDKRNAAVAFARGQLIAPWDDDDISLPWRLSLSVERLGDADYFNPRGYWLMYDNDLYSDDNNPLGINHIVENAHAKSLYTRAAFEAVGGYPSTDSGEDAEFHHALIALASSRDRRGESALDLKIDEWYYIYRWAVGPIHMTFPENYQRFGLFPVQSGTYQILPQWRSDYEAEARSALELLADRSESLLASDNIGAATGDNLPAPEASLTVPADELPLVSCICPTYNRAPNHLHLIEEAIESFLRQTYPNKELIVFNDCPGQELVCDAPGVRVVNVSERFPTLGNKLNAAINLARGELLAPWEDDDISLPWRLSLSVERLGDADYFNPQRYWYWDGDRLRFDHGMGYGHKNSLFTRSAFREVGGYPAASGPHDHMMDAALRNAVRWVGPGTSEQGELSRDEWYYIYRWIVSPVHLTGSGAPDEFYRELGSQPVTEGRFVLQPHWRMDYEAETRRLLEPSEVAAPAAAGDPPPDTAPLILPTEIEQPPSPRRAIVAFVEDHPHLLQQFRALRLSWLYSEAPDTDLVAMGPEEVLERLPDDLVKIAQRPACDDPVWRDYRYVNSIACLNGAGAEQLNRYTHLLRTDVDTFITPAWNAFRPDAFTVGEGGYSNDEGIRQRLRTIAAEYGLTHRGMTNVGSTWYGPTAVVRRTAAFTEMLTKHLIMDQFANDPGEWPGWYVGVALLYASEIAVNHCAPDAERPGLLDTWSTSERPITSVPHIHCWHTDAVFSKHWFMSGRYSREEMPNLDLSIVRDYCLELSFRSVEELAIVP
jgi:glycosyltransferase involved in cell wall biosynthesis